MSIDPWYTDFLRKGAPLLNLTLRVTTQPLPFSNSVVGRVEIIDGADYRAVIISAPTHHEAAVKAVAAFGEDLAERSQINANS